MSQGIQSPQTKQENNQNQEPKKERSEWLRILRYSALRIISLFIAVVIGTYLMILIANMGGYVDEIREARIQYEVSMRLGQDEAFQDLPSEQQSELIEDEIQRERRIRGLDTPFIIRSFVFLGDALTLDLGRSEEMASAEGSRSVRAILLERLPPTLFLFATAQIITFFIALLIAMKVARNYGSKMDKLIIALAPSSAAPSWFYGIFLILIFAAVLGWLPFGRMMGTPVPETTIGYALEFIRHLILPVTAVILSSLFTLSYSFRTYLLIHSAEDYVELAKAKGLSNRHIERRYVLWPTLPPIITAFLLGIISVFMGQMVLEQVFNWPGVGRLLFEAISLYDTPVIIGVIVIFAYLLAIIVFLLDFIYGLIDPRVRIGEGGSS